MKIIDYRYLSILFYLLILSSCIGQTTETPQVWKSKYFDFNVEFDTQWSLLPSIDTKEKSLFGVIDKSDGKSYIIKIVDDVSKDLLSDTGYYQLIKSQMLNENKKNLLIKELDTIIHGKKFHHQAFLMDTKKWGLLKQYAYIYRDGIKMISIQFSFPIEEKNAYEETIPKMLVELDKRIKINGE